MSDEITPRPAPASHGTGPLGRLASLASLFYGDAERNRVTDPVLHRHDGLEDEIDQQIASIDIQTDSGGRHYAVRKPVAEPPDGTAHL